MLRGELLGELDRDRLGVVGRRRCAARCPSVARLGQPDRASGEHQVLARPRRRSAGRAGPGRPGTPSRAPAQASRRLSPPTRRSAPATISAPAPTQLPTATATIGTGNSSSQLYSRVNAAIRATPRVVVELARRRRRRRTARSCSWSRTPVRAAPSSAASSVSSSSSSGEASPSRARCACRDDSAARSRSGRGARRSTGSDTSVS